MGQIAPTERLALPASPAIFLPGDSSGGRAQREGGTDADPCRLPGLPEVVQGAGEGRRQGREVPRMHVPTGDHYDSMIIQGIPRGIQWLDATFARVIASRPAATPRPAALQ